MKAVPNPTKVVHLFEISFQICRKLPNPSKWHKPGSQRRKRLTYLPNRPKKNGKYEAHNAFC